MSPGPFQRFLGVDESADPAALLGLPEEETRDRRRIEAALIKRLEQVHRHPDGQSAEAEAVRRRLREAAASLLGRSPQTGDPKQPVRPRAPRARQARPAPPVRPASPRAGGAGRRQLTAFDRRVLAVLVGSGGWNPTSRARLVALAQTYGVTAPGLMKVVTGLSEYARSGGPRLDVAQMATGSWRFEPRASGPVRVHAPATKMAQVGERLSEELSGRSIWSTVRLSAFFGVLTLILGVIVIRAALESRPIPPGADQGQPPAAAGPAQPVQTPAAQDEEAEALGPRLARFQPLPTFLGNALPLEATEAADQCSDLPELLDRVARRLAITDDPSEAVYRDWTAAVDTIATGWVLADESTRAAIDGGIDEVLFEVADKPSVGDRLLESLLPPTGRVDEPIELWRGSWKAGTLGSIAGSRNLPPAVVQRARTHLTVTVDQTSLDVMDDFTSAAAAWLDQALADLVDVLEYDPEAYDAWEMWIAARRELGDDDRFDAAIMSAARRIIETSVDLSRPGPSANVLGRLLVIADFRTSAVVREAVSRLFNAPEMQVTDDDLWVLTSLLAQSDTAPWFDEDLVLPAGGGKLFRNRIRDRIADRWPPVRGPGERVIAQGRGVSVDARVGRRWLAVRGAMDTQPAARGEEELMARLLIACWLNEAAVLLATREPEEAEAVLGQIDAAMILQEPEEEPRQQPAQVAPGRRPPPPQRIRPPGPLSGAPRRGRPAGPDGEWAVAYEDARGNTEEELRRLNALRTSEGTDLGPVDAEVFVHEVYLGSPHEVRALARSLLIQLYVAGPNVAMEMLDQYPDAPRNRGVSDTIRSYAGRVLPPVGSETWPIEARLALLHHALRLHPGTGSVVDDLAQLLLESCAGRVTAQRPELALSLSLRSPQEGAAHLADVWRTRAGALVASRPLPDDLTGLQRRRDMRRRLAEGPIQRLVAEQLTVLDHLTYVTVAEQPGLYDEAGAVLAESAEARADAGHVLRQAIEAEHAISRIWALRMNLGEEMASAGEVDP